MSPELPRFDETAPSRRRGVLPLPARAAGGRAPKFLIVTADDFGLADEVNRAVEIAHVEGVLTAASLMVGAPAAAGAVETARRLPRLAVGLHLALVDALPVLPASVAPDLVNAHGRLPTHMARLGAAISFLPRVRRQMLAEIRAQFEAFRATGLKLDHVSGHRHFHLHPSVTSAILDHAAQFGVRAVRAPLEPRAVLKRIEGGSSRLAATAARPWARLQRLRLRRAGLTVPDQVFGLAWSGAMTQARLAGLIAHLPDGVSEIYAHPAIASVFAGSAPGYRSREDLAALTSPELRRQIEAAGLVTGGFADAAQWRKPSG
jgi:hopanoid biosynthesis associated protein HpnK